MASLIHTESGPSVDSTSSAARSTAAELGHLSRGRLQPFPPPGQEPYRGTPTGEGMGRRTPHPGAGSSDGHHFGGARHRRISGGPSIVYAPGSRGYGRVMGREALDNSRRRPEQAARRSGPRWGPRGRRVGGGRNPRLAGRV